MSSSVAPNDSVSSTSKKKTRPGKAERAALRNASSVTGVSASASKAAAFAAGASLDPSPQPGRHPVVFPTGAGEPTRDWEFTYDPSSLSKVARSFWCRYKQNPRYAEFRAHAGVTDNEFYRHLAVVFLLSLCQQTVHTHVNMGLPQLDFAPVASSELRVPASILTVTSQYGEFPEALLGNRFVLADYSNEVDKLVWCAEQIWNSGRVEHVLNRAWLPASSSDRNTRLIIADALKKILEVEGISFPGTVLEDAVLSGEVPDFWQHIKDALGDAPVSDERDQRDRFDFLFKAYPDVGQFTTAFTTVEASSVLQELNLAWDNPSAGHLNWSYQGKRGFSELADKWARISAAYAQFFELGSSLASRGNAVGSPAQFVHVQTVDVVTIVRTYLALSAPQFSLSACFPPVGVFSGSVSRNVIVSTPLSVEQRATEFIQADWR